MHITRDYSILVWKDLKLQHFIFNLAPYLKWSSLSSCRLWALTSLIWKKDLPQATTFPSVLRIRKVRVVEKSTRGGSTLLPLITAPCCRKRVRVQINTHLISSHCIFIPHLLLLHCCVYVTWRKQQLLEAKDFREYIMKQYECLHCHNKP